MNSVWFWEARCLVAVALDFDRGDAVLGNVFNALGQMNSSIRMMDSLVRHHC
jgi:hypothetical protein